MANRLKKLADARYTPGTPGQPYVPAYCVTETYKVPGYQSGTTTIVLDEQGRVVSQVNTGPYVPPRNVKIRTCFPAQPYVPAVPPTTTYTAVNGWNGGARSIVQIDRDGFAEFQVNTNPAAVVVGFSDTDVSSLPSEQSHALYIHSTIVDVIERGVVVHTAPISHTYANVYRIERRGLTVTYSSGVWSYTSANPVDTALFLDASIYASGDYVDNPTLEALSNDGTAAGSLAAMVGHGYEGAYAEAYGSLGAMSGEAGTLFVVTAGGQLPALTGVVSEGLYVYGGGTLQALTGQADGGYPEVSLIYGVGIMGSMLGTAHGLTGEVGTVEASLPAMGGLASEGVYGEVRGTLPALTGYADSGWPVPNEDYQQDVVLVGDYYVPSSPASGSIAERLEITDEFAYGVSVDDVIYDALALTDALTVEQAIEAIIEASLTLGNDLSGALRIELPGGVIAGEPLQYAVNVLTGAITTYSGFGFSGFARCGQDLYGCKADGVYRVRRGDDDGDPIQGHIDFGTTDFGSTGVKSVESVYLGVATDGQIVAKLVADGGDERQYRVVQRGPIMRAVTAKGVGGRMWNVALEIIDASEFELDVMEVQVGISRRWGSR